VNHGRHCLCAECRRKHDPDDLSCSEHPFGCPRELPVWRPLTNGEYPPPGPTTLGPLRECGHRVVLVFAPPIFTLGYEEHE
jgi:hypothetical protein